MDEDLWTPVKPKGEPQRKGRIQGQRRNSAAPFTAGHNNRAGHRLYARVNQNRQFRKNVLGLGRWRRGRRLVPGEESWALQTAVPPPHGVDVLDNKVLVLDRRDRRPEQVYHDKVMRVAGLRPGWRRP